MNNTIEVSTTNGTYPAWQEAIRKAQAEAREFAARKEAEDQEELARRKLDAAEQFVKRLALAGIQAKTEDVTFTAPHYSYEPGDPRITIDGYEFTYIRRTDNNILSIAKRLPENPEINDFDPDGESNYMETVYEKIDVYRGVLQASKIADAIDSIETRIPDVLANNARVLERLRDRNSALTLAPTFTEEPIEVVHEWRAEKLRVRLNDLYKSGYRVVSTSTAVDADNDVWTTVIMEREV